MAQEGAKHFEHAAGGLIAVFRWRGLERVHLGRVDSKSRASLRFKE
jgi:hypothetical protein